MERDFLARLLTFPHTDDIIRVGREILDRRDNADTRDLGILDGMPGGFGPAFILQRRCPVAAEDGSHIRLVAPRNHALHFHFDLDLYGTERPSRDLVLPLHVKGTLQDAVQHDRKIHLPFDDRTAFERRLIPFRGNHLRPFRTEFHIREIDGLKGLVLRYGKDDGMVGLVDLRIPHLFVTGNEAPDRLRRKNFPIVFLVGRERDLERSGKIQIFRNFHGRHRHLAQRVGLDFDVVLVGRLFQVYRNGMGTLVDAHGLGALHLERDETAIDQRIIEVVLDTTPKKQARSDRYVEITSHWAWSLGSLLFFSGRCHLLRK